MHAECGPSFYTWVFAPVVDEQSQTVYRNQEPHDLEIADLSIVESQKVEQLTNQGTCRKEGKVPMPKYELSLLKYEDLVIDHYSMTSILGLKALI